MGDDGNRGEGERDGPIARVPASRRNVLAATGVVGVGVAGGLAAYTRHRADEPPDGDPGLLELEDAAELPPLFDCNAWVGDTEVNPVAYRLYRPGPDLGEHFPAATDLPEDLLADMDRVGVDRALVYHITARTEDPKAGNDRVMDAIADHPRLVPSWVITPDAIDDYGGPAGFVEAMDAAGVGAVRMFPGEWSWMHPDEADWHLTDERMAPVLDALEAADAILLLDALSGRVSEGFELSDVETVCRSHEASGPDEPELSVILTQLWPDVPDDLAERVDNLYVDTSRFQAFQAVRPFVDDVGVDRLLFGTHAPHASKGASLATLMQSGLSGAERRAVGWENVARLLDDSPAGTGWRGEDDGQPSGGDSGTASAPSGAFEADETHYKTVPYGIVDLHGHLVGNGDPLVTELDRSGVELSCISNLEDTPLANDATADAVERHPDRLVPVAFVRPSWYDPRGELERCFDELGMRMIKLHPRQDPDDSVYDPIYEFADEREALVVIHAFGDDEHMRMYDDVASAYPNMTFMPYHAARQWQWAENFAELARDHDNVLLEITYSYVVDGIIEYLIDRAGAENVFFGTDIGYRAPQNQVGWAAYERLTPEERWRHMRENGRVLLDELGALPDAYRDKG